MLNAFILKKKKIHQVKFSRSLSTKFQPCMFDLIKSDRNYEHQMIIKLGLSPVLHGQSRESYQSQTRRTAWKFLVLDRPNSSAAGLPPLIKT